MTKMFKSFFALLLAISLVACANQPANEPEPEKEEEVVEEETTEEETQEETVETALAHYEIYNRTGEKLNGLYLYEVGASDKGKNYSEDLHGNHATIDLGELTKDKVFVLEYETESGRVGKFETLHVEEAPITLLSEDAMTGATQIAFAIPEEPAKYALYNATGEKVTDLYVYENGSSDKGTNYAGEGMENETSVNVDLGNLTVDKKFTVEYTTEGGRTDTFDTLSVEVAPITLLAEDDMTGATKISFSKPEWAPTELNAYFGVKYGAAHGTKCFSTAAVAVAEDGTILDAFLDEYQYMNAEGNTGVPNSDAAEGFAANYAEGKVLGSKKVNHESYSAHMAEAAGATQDIKDSYEAIEAFVKGKKVDELASVDEVTGSTLADTASYVAFIVETAKEALNGKSYTVSSYDNLDVVQQDAAAHGDKCFTYVANLMDGETIVATYIDEFQYTDAATEGIEPVPNGTDTENFASGNAEGKVLISKKVNNEYYSASMAEKAGATQEIKASYEAIEAALAGKTLTDSSAIDEVTGSTLADTANYIKAVLDTAVNHK